MDIMLEGEMDGIKSAEEIKKHHDIPVIYLTAYSDESTFKRAKRTETSGYILKEPSGFIYKPFEKSELHSIIEITLYRHKMEKTHDQWISALLESINHALIVTDVNGRIKFMNNMAEDITGWMQEDAVVNKLEKVFRIHNRKSNILKKLKISSSISSEEFTILTKNGTVLTVRADLNHVKDKDGKVNAMALEFHNNFE